MLKHNIKSDVTSALKQGNSEVAGVLRLVLSSVNSKEKEKRYNLLKENPSLKEEEIGSQSELTDEEVVSVLSSEIKKRNDSISLYEKGNRPELAENEKKEIAIIKKYLPEQLSEEELKKLIEDSIVKTGAKEMKDMGKVMADLSPKIKGKADNSEVSRIVKEFLSK